MYRTGAHEKRQAVIRLRVPAWPIVGALFAVTFVVLAAGVLSVAERDASLSCRRDTAGAGLCVRVERYVLRTERTTFDVHSLRGARFVRHKPGRRQTGDLVYVDVDGAETPLGDSSQDLALPAMAARIDRFAHDPTLARLDERYDGNASMAIFLVGLMVALGGGVFVFFLHAGAARRLVLSEEADVATLERRLLFAWKPVWSVPLGEVSGVRAERRGNGARIVLDTKNDGALVASESARTHDPAIGAIASFLDAHAPKESAGSPEA